VRIVTMRAVVDAGLCTGCSICERVCPTLSIRVGEDLIAEVDELTCTGCGRCKERCPEYAIELTRLNKRRVIEVDWAQLPFAQITEICHKAHMNPQEVICYCTGTRAREVAASIILGAKTPEDISIRTGIRTGCGVECIQPILRLLIAAGIQLGKAPGYQWYGPTPIIWDLPEAVVKNPQYQKFYFTEDKILMDRVAELEEGK
jgi:ferredoxin